MSGLLADLRSGSTPPQRWLHGPSPRAAACRALWGGMHAAPVRMYYPLVGLLLGLSVVPVLGGPFGERLTNQAAALFGGLSGLYAGALFICARCRHDVREAPGGGTGFQAMCCGSGAAAAAAAAGESSSADRLVGGGSPRSTARRRGVGAVCASGGGGGGGGGATGAAVGSAAVSAGAVRPSCHAGFSQLLPRASGRFEYITVALLTSTAAVFGLAACGAFGLRAWIEGQPIEAPTDWVRAGQSFMLFKWSFAYLMHLKRFHFIGPPGSTRLDVDNASNNRSANDEDEGDGEDAFDNSEAGYPSDHTLGTVPLDEDDDDDDDDAAADAAVYRKEVVGR